MRAIIPLTVMAVIGTLAVAALLAKGYASKDVDLHDGGVWVTNGDVGLAGRFDAPIRELDASVAISSTSTSAFDLFQEGTNVFVDTGAGDLRQVDVANVTVPTDGARIPADSRVAMGGGIVAVLDPIDGRLWIRPATTVVSLDTTVDKEFLKVGNNAAVTVGRDGTVYAVSGDTDTLFTIPAGPIGPLPATSQSLGTDITHASITVVGDQPVVLGAGGHVVIAGRGEVSMPDNPATSVLQQAGPASDMVVVATDSTLYGVPLRGGDLRTLSDVGTGDPAAPVQLGGCAYGAWSTQPTLVADCPGSGPPAVIHPALATGEGTDHLEFRVNHDTVVLNALGSGGVFTFDRSGQDFGNWKEVQPPQPVPSKEPDNASKQTRSQQNTNPVARNDRYGARAAQATTLPVLENDGDADGDFLVIKSVTAVSDGARLGVVANGQALQLDLPVTAHGSIHFTYTITDGRGGEASASVTVDVHPDDVNSPPAPVAKPREARVEEGGTVTFHVLTDWRDKDGDPLVLASATTKAPDAVRFTPDGFLTFVDGGVTSGKKTVDVQVSDGRADPVKGTVTITVLPPGTADPPHPHDDRVVGFAGQPLTINPLVNDLDANASAPGGQDAQLRLSNVSPAPTGTLVVPDFEDGKITFTATQPRTYYLTYSVTQGDDAAVTARIRIDIQPATGKNPPVAVADVAVLRGTDPTTVDVLANDTDLDGDVLAVSAVSVPDGAALNVSVIEHRWLRIIAPQAGTGAVPIEYTVSDGSATDVGVVTVTQLAPITDNQPPTARDDTAKVRVGDVVNIDVLANDVDPEGSALTLGPDIIAEGDAVGRWYVTGSTVRFQAPATATTAQAHYTVFDADGRPADGHITVHVVPADPAHNQRPQPPTIEARVFAGTVTRVEVPLSGVDQDGDSVVLVGPTAAPANGRIVGQGIDYLDYEAYPGKSGTDSFTYLVRDPYGATGTGTVRIGIIAKPVDDSAPVAVDDVYEVAPGAVVRAPVLANDSDVDGDSLQLEPLTVADPAIGDKATIVDGRVVVTAPAKAGDSVSIQYSVSDGRGLRAFATVRVVSKEDANLPPIAQDDAVKPFPPGATTVDVPVLDNDDDIDGSRAALTVAPVNDGSALPATWLPDARVLRIPLGEQPRLVAYTVTDDHGATATAFVHVPAKGDQPPALIAGAPDIMLAGGTDLALDLKKYISDPQGRPIRLTAAAGISTSPQPGLTVVDGSVTATGLTLHADPSYYGPATLVVQVTDATATTGQQATLVLQVGVTPAQGHRLAIACPPVEPRAGAPAVVIDLRTCVGGLNTAQRSTLVFGDLSGGPGGVTFQRDGALVRVAATRTTAPGTTGTPHFAVGGPWGNSDATLTVRVLAASLARANTDEVERAGAGVTFNLDVTANDTNPFPDAPLKVLSVTPVGGSVTASVDGDGHTIRITPATGFSGVATLSYQLQDALNQASRIVLGRIIVHVVAVPGAPGTPRQSSVGSQRAVVVFAPAEGNGAEIDQYQIVDQSGHDYDCKKETTCQLTDLKNGTVYVFRVRARNVMGWGPLSGASTPVRPDKVPDQPAAPTTKFGDQKVTVTWGADTTSGGSAITKYVVQMSPGGQTLPTTPNQRTVTFTGLTNGASYTFRVEAYNQSPKPSQWSPWSAPEVPAGPPVKPDAPTAAGVNDGIGQQMVVQWIAPADNGAPITNYTLTVLKGGAVVSTVGLAGDLTQTTVDVVNGASYTFQLAATNKAGTSAASAQSAAAVAHGKPGTITSFTVADHDSANVGYDTRVQYALTPPSDNGLAITKYEFDTNGDGATDFTATGSTGYVTGLANGTTYRLTRARVQRRLRAVVGQLGVGHAVRQAVHPRRGGVGERVQHHVLVDASPGRTGGRSTTSSTASTAADGRRSPSAVLRR